MRIKIIFLLGILSVGFNAHSQEIGIKENIGAIIDTSLSFTDETGQEVALKKYFDGQHPVILSLVYYECPSICTVVLNDLTSVLKKIAWTAGNEFNVMSVSINPNDTPALAKEKQTAYFSHYGKVIDAKAWPFLTGTEKNIAGLASQLGFSFKYDSENKQYIHMAALFVLSPDGKIARVLQGISYSPFDLKLALLEAGGSKIGNIFDRALLFLFKYDPIERKYTL